MAFPKHWNFTAIKALLLVVLFISQVLTKIMELASQLSGRATSNAHAEDSPYFDGWKEYDINPYHPQNNPSGIIQMGFADNQLSYNLLEKWLEKHPEASICGPKGISTFKEVANYQDCHGLPTFRKGIASLMEEIGGIKVKIESDRIVLTAGPTAAREVLTFCLADPGEAFLVPTPYYPGFDKDLKWRTGVELIPVEFRSSNDFQVSLTALEKAYRRARSRNITVKGLLITNPSNPLGTTIDADTLKDLLCFACEKNIHLICDEMYGGSVFNLPRFVSIAEIVTTSNIPTDRVHIIYSLSKDMGQLGFRVGVIYSYNNTVVTAARRMSIFCLVSSQTQHLLGAMLCDKIFVREYVEENRKRLRERHNAFVGGLRQAGIPCLDSNVGLFCWVDMRHLQELPGQEGEMKLWKTILKDVGLNVSPGSSYHCEEAGWFRFCIANMDLQTLQLALQRIRSFTEGKRRPIDLGNKEEIKHSCF